MAKTLSVYQEYGFSSLDELDAAYADLQESSSGLKELETTLREKKELQRQVLAYAKTKPTREGLKAQKSEKARAAYRQSHESDFIIAEAAVRYFKARGITKLPARKALQAEIERLTVRQNTGYNEYREKKERVRELQTVKRNIDQMLRQNEPQRGRRQDLDR